MKPTFIALCPYASQFLVFGEGRNFCVALISLDRELTAAWAAAQGLLVESYDELIKLPERDLTVEGGDLTPSLKVKRAIVAERNKELIDSLDD